MTDRRIFVSALKLWAVAVGASFTGATLMAKVSVSVSGPPVPVLPWSLVTIVKVSAPWVLL